MKKYVCKICGNSKDNKNYKIKEMKFGFRDEFEYFECSKCGCLQIAEFPKNISKYYPTDYCAYELNKKFFLIKKNVFANDISEFILALHIDKPPNITRFFSLKNFNYSIKLNLKILDVGCGSGRSFLLPMKILGFNKLYGLDPFVSKETIKFMEENDIIFFNKSFTELDDNLKFDIITFFHSFEHIPEQLETLKKVSNLLNKNGICIIAVPIKSEYIWKKYETNWVQIDAPRHFFIHTEKSLIYLAEKAGLKLKYLYYDSTEFQFIGSEKYLRNIPLISEKNMFTEEQKKEYKKLAEELNKKHQGDQAVFFFVKD